MSSRVGTGCTVVPRVTSVMRPVQDTSVLAKRRDELRIEKAVVCQVSWMTCQNDHNYIFSIIEIIKTLCYVDLVHLLVHMVYLSVSWFIGWFTVVTWFSCLVTCFQLFYLLVDLSHQLPHVACSRDSLGGRPDDLFCFTCMVDLIHLFVPMVLLLVHVI